MLLNLAENLVSCKGWFSCFEYTMCRNVDFRLEETADVKKPEFICLGTLH